MEKKLLKITILLFLLFSIYFVSSLITSFYSVSYIVNFSENYTIRPVYVGLNNLAATAHNTSWLEFDGVNDYVYSSLAMSGNYSVSLWFKAVNSSQNYANPNDNVALFWNDDDSPAIKLMPSRSIRFCTKNSSGTGVAVEALNNFTDNQWINVIGVVNNDTGNISIFVNGEFKAEDSFVGGSTDSPQLNAVRIGRDDAGRNFKGSIDEIRVYNSTLTDSEILEIYNSGRIANSSLPSDGLVLWYSFNEGTGSIVYDKSGNSNNGQ